MNFVDYAREKGIEIRIKPTLGAYCELCIIDNGRNTHEVSVVPETEVNGKSAEQIDDVIWKHLRTMEGKIEDAAAMHELNLRASERRAEFHKFWINA